jgi:hypothetical protein
MKLVFLKADVPLTKSFTLKNKTIETSSYPSVLNFTSHEITASNLIDFNTALRKYAALKYCLLKGEINRPLVDEPRAGSTDSSASTEWVCLDVDGVDVQTPEDFLQLIGITDVSYVVQYSASHGVKDQSLRCHIFMMLTKPMPAALLKQWLKDLNFNTPELNAALQLTKSNMALRWPLDITTCQNDKLLYIAPPIFNGNAKDPFKTGRNGQRIQMVKKRIDTLNITNPITSTAENRKREQAKINELRELAGMPERKYTYKMYGATEVLLKPDSSIITEMKQERGFVYFNLNGGDSWAYYHPEDNPDFIFNFKGEPAYLTKELLPDYWNSLVTQASRTSSAGVTYLAFLDKRSGSYYRGTYDTGTDELDIYIAKNETQVRHFAKQVGLPLGDFIPEWEISFDPHDNVRVDVNNRSINTFVPTPFMVATPRSVTAIPPTINKVLHHALGSDPAVTEHFINWLATILQTRGQTRTAWLLHGTQGCLAAETRLQCNRGKRHGGREITVKEAYEKWTGSYKLGKGRGKTWDLKHSTRLKAVKDNMTIGYHEIFDIVQSGVKTLYTLTTNTGRTIRVTRKHPFMRPDGKFTELQYLKAGSQIVVEGVTLANVAMPQGRKARTTIHSIPHHPYAWKHMIAGKDYKRSHKARLVIEADMNYMTLDEFLIILRTDPRRAAKLRYLRNDEIVHHLDEDPGNDALSNLVVIDKLNHDRHHAKEVGLGTISTAIETVVSIVKGDKEMTYDIVMKAPYHNYVANGFVVHNTGKGVLMNSIIRPIFGFNQTAARRMEEFNEPYNGYMQNAFIVFVDEVQTSALRNEKGVIAKLKNFITEDRIVVRQMYQSGYEVQNYSNWIFASNMPDPINIEVGDRRFNVGGYQALRLQLAPMEIARIERELQPFHDYLAAYTIDEQLAGTPLETAARQEIIAISEEVMDTVAGNLLAGNMGFFIDALPTNDSYKSNMARLNAVEDYKKVLVDLINRPATKQGHYNISRDELYTIFSYNVGNMPESPNKFTGRLKHHRIQVKKVTIDGKTHNGIQVEWQDVQQFGAYLFHINDQQPTKLKAVK